MVKQKNKNYGIKVEIKLNKLVWRLKRRLYFKMENKIKNFFEELNKNTIKKRFFYEVNFWLGMDIGFIMATILALYVL